MSLNLQEMLQSLAASELAMVMPALGDSYAGKTAGLIGGLLAAAASLPDRLLQEAPRLRAALEELLAGASVDDAALRADIDAALADPAGNSWFARQDRLLRALEDVHAWADAHDAALARRCRDFLVDLAGAEMILPPAADDPAAGAADG